jgi:hypothetical protein
MRLRPRDGRLSRFELQYELLCCSVLPEQFHATGATLKHREESSGHLVTTRNYLAGAGKAGLCDLLEDHLEQHAKR